MIMQSRSLAKELWSNNMYTIITKEKFKEVRTKLQYTQRELSEMLGVTITSISRYENGERAISRTISLLLNRIYKSER